MPDSQLGSKLDRIFKHLGKLLGKIVCILDDIPFLLKQLLPTSLLSIGSYILAAAGFIVFPLEGYEGIKKFKKAYHLPMHTEGRLFGMVSNAAKIAAAAGGLAVSSALLAFTITAAAVLGTITAVFVPGILTIITAIEFIQKCYKYHLKKNASPAEDSQANVISAERKVGFGATYLTLSTLVTVCATLATLVSLGIITGGIAPVVALICLVVMALGVGIFEMVDKNKDNKFTKAMRKFFRGSAEPAETANSYPLQQVVLPSPPGLSTRLPASADQRTTSIHTSRHRARQSDDAVAVAHIRYHHLLRDRQGKRRRISRDASNPDTQDTSKKKLTL